MYMRDPILIEKFQEYILGDTNDFHYFGDTNSQCLTRFV